ncbi:hypothetical protein BJ912DRAFT_418928 [Pholiota molesta]|nr:hypothetical protein BJ912DRAFT_418928 [Pholiota molesta]
MGRCPVFCIDDIPLTTLDLLLQCTEEYLSEINSPSDDIFEASEYLVIMDTKDIATITQGSSHPMSHIMSSSPTAFLGLSLKEVHDWFITNINQPGSDKFTPYCFLVLDNKSIEDDSCIFVCTIEDEINSDPEETDSAPEEIQSLRCVFELAYQNVIACDIQGRSIEDNGNGCWMRSGVTMTEENYKLVEHGGSYIEDGEVKLDQP